MAYFHEAQANYLVQEVFFFIILSIQTLGVAYLRMWPEPSIFNLSIRLVPVVQREDTTGYSVDK